MGKENNGINWDDNDEAWCHTWYELERVPNNMGQPVSFIAKY